MLAAKRSKSLFFQATSKLGNSNPTPGPCSPMVTWSDRRLICKSRGLNQTTASTEREIGKSTDSSSGVASYAGRQSKSWSFSGAHQFVPRSNHTRVVNPVIAWKQLAKTIPDTIPAKAGRCRILSERCRSSCSLCSTDMA